jgi:hypothetical protein
LFFRFLLFRYLLLLFQNTSGTRFEHVGLLNTQGTPAISTGGEPLLPLSD